MERYPLLKKSQSDLLFVEEFQYEERNWQLELGWEILGRFEDSSRPDGKFVVWINGDRVDDFPKIKKFDRKTISSLWEEIINNKEAREGLSRYAETRRRHKELRERRKFY